MQFGILTSGGQTGSAMPLATLVMWIVVMVGIFYFMAIRPQKKQQKKMDAMISTLENGDSVLTSGGFYGVVIDVMDDVVIVEFGNNKNCRIPMKKTAISEIEKPQSTAVAKETKE